MTLIKINKILRKILLIPKVKQAFERISQFYEGVRLENIEQLSIKGGFNKSDAKALEKVIQMVLKKNVMVAEIGSWVGNSTSVLAKAVADYHGSVFAVDHWMGSEGVPHHEIAKGIDIYSIFKHHLITLELWDVVYPLVMDSQTASKIFADEILDLVFVDGDHRYESVKKDISAWLPKLRNGGILCGHDCEGYYSEYPEEAKKIIEEHLENDYVSIPHPRKGFLGDEYNSNICHPGVVKALYEYFKEEYSIVPNTTVWYYQKMM